jgi:phage gp36-like protein
MATSYATQGEFLDQVGIGVGFEDVPGATIDTALLWASSRVNSYIKKRVTLPLLAWSTDLTEATCKIAKYRLINRRGIDGQSGNNQTVIDDYKETIDWLRDVSKGLVELDAYTDSDQTLEEAAPLASSDPITDWDYTTRHSDSSDEC